MVGREIVESRKAPNAAHARRLERGPPFVYRLSAIDYRELSAPRVTTSDAPRSIWKCALFLLKNFVYSLCLKVKVAKRRGRVIALF